MELLDIGYGNLVSRERIVAITHPNSAPAKRFIKAAAAIGKLIDASSGRKTESVIVTDSDHVILSPLSVEILSKG